MVVVVVVVILASWQVYKRAGTYYITRLMGIS